MKKSIFFIILLASLIFSLAFVSAQNSVSNVNQNYTTLYFFYGNGCPHCAAAEPFLAELQNKYNFTLIAYEVWYNETNKLIFQNFIDNYNLGITSITVPVFLMGNRHVIGFDNADSLGKSIDEMISECLDNNCKQTQNLIRFSIFGRNIEISKNMPIIFLGVILGLADGLNPCTFAILIFLMSYLFTLSASKGKILKLGLIFALVIFIVYALLMKGLSSLVSSFGVNSYIKIIIGLILLVIAVINIKDFFKKGWGPSLEIPERARPILERYIKKATVPAIIILAIILSLVEVGCTLGLPLAYVTTMAQNGIVGIANILYILWYCIFYVVPLLIIIFLIYFFVLEADKAEEYRIKFRRWMKLIGGMIMLVLAILLFFWLDLR